MKIIEPGHIYQLQHLDGSGAGVLVFVNREEGDEHEGTQTQDVIRVLIDRTQHCDGCLRWEGNDKIIWHLRQALALHESRAIERKAAKGVIEPEKVPTAKDGHFQLGGPEDRRPGLHINSRGSRRVDRLPTSPVPMTLEDAVTQFDCSTLRMQKTGNYLTLQVREDEVGALGEALVKYDDGQRRGPPRRGCLQQEGNCKAADCPEHGWSRG